MVLKMCLPSLKPGLRFRGDEQTLPGHHGSSVEGHHLHCLLRNRSRRQRHEQGHNPLHDVTNSASQNYPVLQQRPGAGQAISGRDFDAGTGIHIFLSLLPLVSFFLSFLFSPSPFNIHSRSRGVVVLVIGILDSVGNQWGYAGVLMS